MERAAAEFFSARVLSVSDAQLKVQTADDGEPVLVARSDAYRIPPPPLQLAPGDPAICHENHERWVACRVIAPGPRVRALLITGEERPLSAHEVITPTPVTALNVQRLFESADARRRFATAASHAGDPLRPRAWVPEPREPVLARRSADWFSAHVASLQEDGGVSVVWEGDPRPQSVSGDRIVPIPPFAHAFARGEFALVRPASVTEPWQRFRIEAIGNEEAVMVGEGGERRRVSLREIVPLGS